MLYLFKVSKLRKALLVCGTIQLAIGTIGSLGVTYDKMIKCATLVTLSLRNPSDRLYIQCGYVQFLRAHNVSFAIGDNETEFAIHAYSILATLVCGLLAMVTALVVDKRTLIALCLTSGPDWTVPF